jgi:hypothetical protein
LDFSATKCGVVFAAWGNSNTRKLQSRLPAPHSVLSAELSMDADHGLQSLSAKFQSESSRSIRLFDTEQTPVRVAAKSTVTRAVMSAAEK